MYSSHRIMTAASHSNPGVFSQETGQKLFYRTIADCHVTNDVIDDEWLIRDNGAIVRQLDKTPEAYARELIQEYDRAAIEEYPGGNSGISYQCADDFWMKLRAAIPSATFQIEHQIDYQDAMLSPRAAIRWSLRGKHEGWGAFGQPTGVSIFIMGVTHAEFGPWGLRRKYTLFDETMIWKQIYLHKG